MHVWNAHEKQISRHAACGCSIQSTEAGNLFMLSNGQAYVSRISDAREVRQVASTQNDTRYICRVFPQCEVWCGYVTLTTAKNTSYSIYTGTVSPACVSSYVNGGYCVS